MDETVIRTIFTGATIELDIASGKIELHRGQVFEFNKDGNLIRHSMMPHPRSIPNIPDIEVFRNNLGLKDPEKPPILNIAPNLVPPES